MMYTSSANYSFNTLLPMNNTLSETMFPMITSTTTNDYPGSYTFPPFCSDAGEIYSIFYLIIFAMLALSIIPIARRFLINLKNVQRTNTRKQTSKVHRNTLYYSGLAFVIFTFIYLGLASPIPYLLCTIPVMEMGDKIGPIILTTSTFYFVQYTLLLFLNFYRMYITFLHTPLQFTKFLVWYYRFQAVSLYALIISFPVVLTQYVTIDKPETIKVALGILNATFYLIAILTASTTYIFIYKLVKVYKMDSNKDENGQLIRVMTKTAFLTMISIFITILTYLFNRVDLGFDPLSETRRNIADTISTMDVYTNLICFVLTFQSFEKYYNKLCGCCDSKCQRMCIWMVNRNVQSTWELNRSVSDVQNVSEI